MKLDWSHWIYGLFAALIGGGAASIGAAVGAMRLAPGQFGLSGDAGWTSLKLMGWTFLISGIIAAAAYLKQSPLPAIEPDTTTTTIGITTQPGAQPKTTTTVSETHTEPKP